MCEPGIEATGLTKQFGTTTAVSELSLSIGSGTVYGFLGPNGAGKTTTMRMLVSLITPTSGTARVAGVPVTDRAKLTECIGYLPADPPVFEELTGREQLRYVARLQGLSEETASDRIQDLLERFDVAESADRRLSEYSTGMRKKIGLVGSILHEPPVVFLDEPTSGLDPQSARTVRQTITELADRDTTIFLSSHVLPVVEELADEVGVIHDGRLVAEGTPGELERRVEDGRGGGLERAFLEITTDREPESGEKGGRDTDAIYQ